MLRYNIEEMEKKAMELEENGEKIAARIIREQIEVIKLSREIEKKLEELERKVNGDDRRREK